MIARRATYLCIYVPSITIKNIDVSIRICLSNIMFEKWTRIETSIFELDCVKVYVYMLIWLQEENNKVN